MFRIQWIVFAIFYSVFSMAQESKSQTQDIDIETLCSSKKLKVGEVDYQIVDNGFCEQISKIKTENEKVDKTFVEDITETLNQIPVSTSQPDIFCTRDRNQPQINGVNNLLKEDIHKKKWILRFYASHSFTTYYDTDISFRSTRYNVDVKDYTWTERGSRNFFNPVTWFQPGNNPLQIIDEPSNKFVLSLEKDGHEFFLSAFHPKFFQTDQTKYIKGTIDGVEVDGFAPLNKPFDGYNQSPGEMELVRNQNTGGEMIWEIGYGHRFKLLSGKAGNLTYTPSLAIGVTTGSNYSVVIKEGQWWEFDDYTEPYRFQGFGGTVSNRIEYSTPNDRLGLYYENNLGLYQQKHGFLDGTQAYQLKFMGNNVGLVFRINKKK